MIAKSQWSLLKQQLLGMGSACKIYLIAESFFATLVAFVARVVATMPAADTTGI